MPKTLGDSGTFGSQATMNAIKARQSMPIPTQQALQRASQQAKFSKAGNKTAKAQLTGKWMGSSDGMMKVAKL